MEKQTAFEQVSEARGIVLQHRTAVSELSDATRDEYRRIVKRLGERPWWDATKSRTAYLQKAALQAMTVSQLAHWLDRLEGAQRRGDEAAYRAAIQRIERLLTRVREHALFSEHKETGQGLWKRRSLDQKQTREEAGKEIAKKGGNRSKKIGLTRLPPDWQEKVAASMDYPIELDVYALAGVRPADLAGGVRVSKKGDFLAIEVTAPAKVDVKRGKGQIMRRIRVPIETAAARRLAAFASTGGTIIKPSKQRLHNLRIRLASVSKRLFKQRLSPYSYRHALSGRMKGTGLPKAMIAVALGHRSVRTQNSYGRPLRGGPPPIADAEGSHEPRNPPRAGPPQRSAAGTHESFQATSTLKPD